MLTLYGKPKSRSLRVSWTLEELDVDWDYFLVDFNSGAKRDPEFLAVSPQGKVPVLKDGDLVLIESAAICMFLAEKYGDGRLLPKRGSDLSGLHHQWVSFITNELEQPLWSIGKHKFALPESLRIPEMVETANWEFNKALKTVELWLPESGMVLGQQFTVADILLTHTLNWAVGFEQTLTPKAAAYRQRVKSRPALASALGKELAAAKKI
jgi:glutathione S-transferase